jgi:hypothetical protein
MTECFVLGFVLSLILKAGRNLLPGPVLSARAEQRQYAQPQVRGRFSRRCGQY